MNDVAGDPAAFAAKSVYNLLVERLRDDQGVHAETALCAAGAITGDAIAAHSVASAEPAATTVSRVLAYIRERCTLLSVVLPETDESDSASGSTRDAASLANELRAGVLEVVGRFGQPPNEVPFVLARCIPALLSNTSAVLDPRVGYGIALQALRSTAVSPRLD